MIWHILISESVSVYGRYVVGLLSVWVRDCRSVVGYDSSIVLMIGFQSVSCWLSIGFKSGDSTPNLTRNDPGMNPTGITVSSSTLSVTDSWPIHRIFFCFVLCRFGRCDWGIRAVNLSDELLMTSSNGNIFRVTGLFRGIHRSPANSPHKAGDAELWCFLWSTPEPTVEQTIKTPVIWDAIALITTSL